MDNCDARSQSHAPPSFISPVQAISLQKADVSINELFASSEKSPWQILSVQKTFSHQLKLFCSSGDLKLLIAESGLIYLIINRTIHFK